jgi:hypothetical protein
MSSKISPFKVAVPESKLEAVQKKLDGATFPAQVDFSDDWNYGVPLSDMKRLTEYWRDSFDWRAQEKEINKLPQFTAAIDVDGFGELNIHFVHQRSDRLDSIPLLFCHGCKASRARQAMRC